MHSTILREPRAEAPPPQPSSRPIPDPQPAAPETTVRLLGVNASRAAVRRLLLGSGILSSVLYVLVVSLPYEGYSPVSQNVSELLAVGAPTRPLIFVLLIAVYNILVLALAAGVWISPGRKRMLRLTAVMLGVFAILGAITGGIFNMDMRGAESTPRGALHLTMTTVMSIPLVLSLVFGAFLHGWRFGLLSLATILAAAVGGALTAQDVPMLAANMPTPWMGLKERINIYPYMLWVAALAISLWPGRGSGSATQGNPTTMP